MNNPQPISDIHSQSLSDSMARFAVECRSEDIPDSALEVMRWSILDWCGVALAGYSEPVSEKLRRLALHDGGREEATIVGSPVKVPVRSAALVNGSTSHALDYDDSHFSYVGHPSAAVIPAVLAVSEQRQVDLTRFVEAALIGVEATCRIGQWLGRDHYQAGFHQTATSGCLGAALAVSRLLNLSFDETLHALGLATTRASGLKSQFGTMGKPYNAGIAATNGVEVALLAADGFVSRPDGLECEQGFGPSHHGENYYPDTVLDGLGRRFIFESIQHKFHACCHGLHAAIEALKQARDEHGLSASDIDSVNITTNPRWLKVCNIAEPETGLQAKFSYRQVVAMVMNGQDTSALASYSESACADGHNRQMRNKVNVVDDANLSDTESVVRLVTTSGTELESRYDLEAPLQRSVREQKVLAKADSLVGNHATVIWNCISGQGTRPVSELSGLLKEAV